MFPLLAGIATGGLGLLGSLFSSNSTAQNNQANIQAQAASNAQMMDFNASQAEINRSYQSQEIRNMENYQSVMSNTAYQRSRQDMEAAGLNPILAAGAGGASTPSGGAGTGSSPTVSLGTPKLESPGRSFENLGRVATDAVNSAVNVKTYEKMTDEIARLRAEEARIKAETDFLRGPRTKQTEAETTRTGAQTGLTRQETRTEEQNTLARSNQNTILGLSMPGYRVSAREAEAKLGLPSWLADTIVQGDYIGNKVTGALQPIESLFNSSLGALRYKAAAREASRSRTTTQTNYDKHGNESGGWARKQWSD